MNTSADDIKIVEEWLALLRRDGSPLPPATAGRNVSEKIASTSG